MPYGRYPKVTASSVNPKILKIAREMSKQLTKRGIPHALIGGLAVGVHGYERATGDVDFLVSGSAQSELTGDPLGGEAHGKTITFKGVIVDLLFPSPDQRFLENDIRHHVSARGLPVISKEALIYMKLVASRMRDSGDIVELLKRGKVDDKKVIAYLRKHRPDLVDDFKSLVLQAKHEPI